MSARHAMFAGLVLAATSLATQAGAPAAPPDLTPRLNALADRVAAINAQADRIDDYNQLRNLQRIYGFYFDEALWDQVLDLFASDATVEIGQHGQYIGKDSIRRYYLGLTGGRQGLQHGTAHGPAPSASSRCCSRCSRAVTAYTRAM